MFQKNGITQKNLLRHISHLIDISNLEITPLFFFSCAHRKVILLPLHNEGGKQPALTINDRSQSTIPLCFRPNSMNTYHHASSLITLYNIPHGIYTLDNYKLFFIWLIINFPRMQSIE